MRYYIAGPMRSIPQFNFPAFFAAHRLLLDEDHEVFNPAARDIQKHGWEVQDSPTGDIKDIAYLGFDLRKTFLEDLKYICTEADAIALLPGWERSKGATAEKAVAETLGLKVRYL